MMFGTPLVVADQAAVTHQSSEGSLDDPAARHHDEPAGVVAAFDHGDRQPQHPGRPAHQAPGVAAVGPDQGDRGEPLAQHRQQRAGPVTVLHAGRGDHHGQQQAQGVDREVPLPPVDLLAAIETPARGPDRVSSPW